MFDIGKSKPKVVGRKDLAGSLTREQLIAKAHSERHQRATEQQNMLAATTIQAVFRSFRGRRRFAVECLADFTSKVGDINKLKSLLAAAGKPLNLSSNVVYGLVRKYCGAGTCSAPGDLVNAFDLMSSLCGANATNAVVVNLLGDELGTFGPVTVGLVVRATAQLTAQCQTGLCSDSPDHPHLRASWQRVCDFVELLVRPSEPLATGTGTDALSAATWQPPAAAVYAARLFMLSPAAANAFQGLQLSLLQACARVDAGHAIAQMYAHPATKALVLLAMAAVAGPTSNSQGTAQQHNNTPGMVHRVQTAFVRHVLALPLLARQSLVAAHSGPVALGPVLASCPSWLTLLGSVGDATSSASGSSKKGEAYAALESLRCAFTLGNVLDVQKHCGQAGGALLPALAALLQQVPHITFALRAAAADREHRTHIHLFAPASSSTASSSSSTTRTGVALARAAEEGEGGAGALEDAALEYGDTDEAVMQAANRNAELALMISRRGTAVWMASCVNGGGPRPLLPGSTLQQPRGSGAGAGASSATSPPAFLTGNSFSGGSSLVSLIGLGLHVSRGQDSVLAKLQAKDRDKAGAGQASKRAAGMGDWPTPTSASGAGSSAGPARRVRPPSYSSSCESTVDHHSLALLALAPLQEQLAQVYSSQSIAAMLHQASTSLPGSSSGSGGAGQGQGQPEAGPIAALAMLHSLHEKLRLGSGLAFTVRAAEGPQADGNAYVRLEASCVPAGAPASQHTMEAQSAASALLDAMVRPLAGRGKCDGDAVMDGSASSSQTPVSLLQAAWRAVSSHPELRRFTAGSASDSMAEYPALAAALTLLMEALAHVGEQVDDATLVDGGRPLPVEDVRAVLAVMRGLLYRLAWADRQAVEQPLTRRPYAVLSLLVPTLTAFNSLYDRHVRRPGWLAGTAGRTPGRAPTSVVGEGDALFLWPELPASDLSVEAILGLGDMAVADESMAVDVEGPGAGAGGTQDRTGALEAAALANGEEAGVGYRATAHGSLRSSRVLLVLTSCPQVVPFGRRVSLFNGLRERDKEEHAPGMTFFQLPNRIQFRVRRASLLADSYTAFSAIVSSSNGGPNRLKERFRIEFINELGQAESGIDGGGLLKEFTDSVVREAFNPSAGLFKATAGHRVYPNPDPLPTPLQQGGAGTGSGSSDEGQPQGSPWATLLSQGPLSPSSLFEFLGRLLGKALYEGILVEPRFAPFVLRRLLGRGVTLDDLAGYDTELYRQLVGLKDMARGWDRDADMPDPVAELGLTMAVTDEVGGVPVTVPLVPGGESVTVTSATVEQYVARLARYRLHTCVAAQVRAFLRGFRELIPLPWMRMFGAHELGVLLGGREQAGFDVADLKAHCGYNNGYHEGHPVIRGFWRVIEGLSPADQSAFLAFVTSVPRPPLMGFASLRPKFGISRIPIDHDSQYLPVAGTCANLLKLPTYSNEAVLKEKLLYAIHSGAGFELT